MYTSSDDRITVDGTFNFTYPCYLDTVGVQLSGVLNVADFQEGDFQIRDLFAEAGPLHEPTSQLTLRS